MLHGTSSHVACKTLGLCTRTHSIGPRRSELVPTSGSTTSNVAFRLSYVSPVQPIHCLLFAMPSIVLRDAGLSSWFLKNVLSTEFIDLICSNKSRDARQVITPRYIQVHLKESSLLEYRSCRGSVTIGLTICYYL